MLQSQLQEILGFLELFSLGMFFCFLVLLALEFKFYSSLLLSVLPSMFNTFGFVFVSYSFFCCAFVKDDLLFNPLSHFSL